MDSGSAASADTPGEHNARSTEASGTRRALASLLSASDGPPSHYRPHQAGATASRRASHKTGPDRAKVTR